MLQKALPDGRTSPNQTPVLEIVLGFLASILTGGFRFAHIARLRGDKVISAILGLTKEVASAMTLTRYFRGFVRSHVEHLTEVLWKSTFERISPRRLGYVLDMDSSVFERYGVQEGSLKGYNPKKRGRPSHHPIFAFLAEAKIIVHLWLRSGNTGTANGATAFLSEALAKLPQTISLYAFRADAGFYIHEFLTTLEHRGLPYAIAVKFTSLIQHAIFGISTWTSVDTGLAVGEMQFMGHNWSHPRRIVVLRETVNERECRGKTLKLFDILGYKYRAIITTLPYSAIEVVRFYNARGDCENRLRELKEDFNLDKFCLDSFNGTEAALRLICFLFNLISEFKRDVLHDESIRLSRIRVEVFVVGAILGAEGRDPILRLGLTGPFRERFAKLLAIIHKLTVTQFVLDKFLAMISVNSTWHRPKVKRRHQKKK